MKANKMNIEEIIRLAFLKYRLSSRKSMNTFIFTQAKNNKLTDEEIDTILNTLENKIQQLEEEKQKKLDQEIQEELEKVLQFNCNLKAI